MLQNAATSTKSRTLNRVKVLGVLAVPVLAVMAMLAFAFIVVPTNADPGSHWGAILVRTSPQTSEAGSAIQANIGTFILVRVLGEAKEKLFLESLSAPRFLQSPPFELEARFR